MNININGNVNIAVKKEIFQQLLFLSSDAQSLVRIRYLYLVHVCGTDFSSFLNSIFLSFAEPPFHALRAKKMDIYSTNQIASTHMDVNIAKIENTTQRKYLIVEKYHFQFLVTHSRQLNFFMQEKILNQGAGGERGGQSPKYFFCLRKPTFFWRKFVL